MRKEELRKVDLFKADRKMSTRVEEYVKCRVLRKAINKDFGDQIAVRKQSISNLEKLRGSVLESNIEPQKELFLADIASLEAKRIKQLEDEATFEFTDADKKFKKTLKGLSMDSPKVAEAVIEWFKNYNLDVTNSTLLADILLAIGGKEDFHKLVDTEGKDGISVDNNKALSMLYWVTFRHMAEVGTIKPAQIPDIIKNNFGKKALEKKKAERLAQRKAKKEQAKQEDKKAEQQEKSDEVAA